MGVDGSHYCCVAKGGPVPACCLRRPHRLSITRGLFRYSNVTYGVEYNSTLEMPVQGGSWYVVYSSHPLRGEKAPASKVSKVVEFASVCAFRHGWVCPPLEL